MNRSGTRQTEKKNHRDNNRWICNDVVLSITSTIAACVLWYNLYAIPIRPTSTTVNDRRFAMVPIASVVPLISIRQRYISISFFWCVLFILVWSVSRLHSDPINSPHSRHACRYSRYSCPCCSVNMKYTFARNQLYSWLKKKYATCTIFYFAQPLRKFLCTTQVERWEKHWSCLKQDNNRRKKKKPSKIFVWNTE